MAFPPNGYLDRVFYGILVTSANISYLMPWADNYDCIHKYVFL